MKKTARCWSGLYYKTMRCRNSDSSVVLLSNIKTLQRVGGAVAALSKALLVREIINENQNIPGFAPGRPGQLKKSFGVIITMQLRLQLWPRNWNSNLLSLWLLLHRRQQWRIWKKIAAWVRFKRGKAALDKAEFLAMWSFELLNN